MREENLSLALPSTDADAQSIDAEPARRHSILVVDDEAPNRRLLRAVLESSYDVTDVDAAGPALQMLATRSFDLVLVDVMMPGMTGFELCRHLKLAQGEYLPVILLTALGRQDDRNAGLQAGADDFVTKPFDRQELLLRVRTFLKLRDQDQRIRRQLSALREQEQIIKRQVAELHTIDAMKDEMVGLLVHDLRNPLTGITGFLSLLIEDTADSDARQEAINALEASDRAREILDDLLAVRMLESGTLALRYELVHAESLVKDAIGSLAGEAKARQVRIAEVVDGDDLSMVADCKLVRRAVENLLSNALKYSPGGSTVRAAIRSHGPEIEIEIADRGCGIPSDLQGQVFQKFASVEAWRGEARRGVGLGLYLVSLVASAHGGHARVRHRKHGGAAFGLCLPKLEGSQPRIKVAS
jgi:two-component system, sensor histidine kinase and response regulator